MIEREHFRWPLLPTPFTARIEAANPRRSWMGWAGHLSPATLDNVVTGGGTEDHNSMGSIAAARLPRLLHNVRGVIACELLAAAQALDDHAPLRAGAGTAAAR